MALEEEDSEDDQGPVGLRQLFEMSLPEVELRQSFCVRPLGRRHRQRPDAQQGSADDDDDQEENLDEVEICDAKGNTSATEAENDDVVLDAQELDIRVLCAEMDQGIFLARLQARLHRRRGYVVLTDRDPFLLDMIQRNAAKNATAGPMLPVETAELSWGADDPSLDAFRRKYSRRPFDLIVGDIGSDLRTLSAT
ncbi:Hypothetical Protein FCC1311_017610 [Hondaea fermentalgiana]|uniref:Uncharacterized protein n=1 Tax=Hondaea fermentalgiana TaxID=2315210 RepID=A0A2R5GF14_9STRA|nr:Hypothetical Protein FCC1311_017610 [Hondaea fermentalgiana]|eukprot:GBG27203.1 Hypothetical Protein FCC1311_017610 [Hondaea fermentalgiana]